jgi:large subunit ribosomal protein L21
MSYAIISLGGKQYRVQPGERLLVDRVKTEAGKTFQPTVLLVGGDGKSADLKPSTPVTARVLEHVRGEKIRIGKYRPKNGFKKHTGYRSALTRIEIEAIGSAKAAAPAKKAETPKAEAAPKPPKAEAAPKPKPETVPTPQAEPADAAPPAQAEAVPTRTAHPPKGYEEMTVAQIAEAASGWRRPNLEAALEYEKEHAKRKGAIAALESALAEESH